jgi:hypothetical protein
MGLFLAAVLVMARSDGRADQPQLGASADPKVSIAENGGARKNRPAHRIARASSEDVVSTERRRNRSRRARPGRRARQVEKGDDARIHLHLSGSYELNLGNDRFARGEGSTTIRLDRAVAERLRIGIGQRLQGAGEDRKEFLNAVGTIPATLDSISEILKALSDPKTQEALRQVEQLLQLLPQSSPQAVSEE